MFKHIVMPIFLFLAERFLVFDAGLRFYACRINVNLPFHGFVFEITCTIDLGMPKNNKEKGNKDLC